MQQQRYFFFHCEIAAYLGKANIIANTYSDSHSGNLEDLKRSLAVLKETFLATIPSAANVPFIVFSLKAAGRPYDRCSNCELVGAPPAWKAVTDVAAQLLGQT